MKYSCYVSVSEQTIYMRRVWPSLWGLRAGSRQTRSFSTPSASATKVPTPSDQDNKLSYVSLLFYTHLGLNDWSRCPMKVLARAKPLNPS